MKRRLAAVAKGLGLFGLVSVLSACSFGDGLYGPISGDSRPHSGVDRARRLPVQGIDVARYQGDIDFAALMGSGIRFVFIKATEGKDYIDPNFYRNWEAARAAGLPRGAYHFMNWCSSVPEQAEWFRQKVPNEWDALPPVLDLEWQSGSSCRNRESKEVVLAKVLQMAEAMERHTGRLPIIYTDINFHRDVLEGVALPYTFWLRSTAAEPQERYGNRQWTFWQWTQTGVVKGIEGDVDRNAFFGSDYDWQVFRETGCDVRNLTILANLGRCYVGK